MRKKDLMGKFTAIGMRDVVPKGSLVINTCSGNDGAGLGGPTSWAWANPTNTELPQEYAGYTAISVECLWQGMKVFASPDPDVDVSGPDIGVLAGDWRKGKSKKPVGHWAGEGQPLITDVGEARRTIYIPAYANQIMHWLDSYEMVDTYIQRAAKHDGPVFLRDYDTGRGVDNKGPMSHAWVLAYWLNNAEWPQ